LQKAAYKSTQIITEHCVNVYIVIVYCVSAQKTKLAAFKGRDPVTSKTEIDNKIIEKTNFFTA
jgi:hypothetical protein